MDPVKILDHYRLPLVHSRDGVHALARLLRNGPQNSANLAASVGLEAPETNRLLISLYRAALVENPGTDLWSISVLGEQVLDRLRVLDVAAADLAESLATTEPDRWFLRTWLRHPVKDRDSRTCLSLLRSLHHMDTLKVDWQGAPASRSPLLYAIVIAADKWVQHARVENVWEVISHGQPAGFLEAGRDAAATSDDNEKVAAAWRAGMRRYLDSNRLLLILPDTPEPTDHETVEFTWLRAVDAVMRGSADEGLRASCSRWQRNDTAAFWKFMFNQRSVERNTRVLCQMQGWLDQPSMTGELLAELSERLFKAIGDEPHDVLREPSRVGAPLRGDEFHDLVLRVRHATERVKQEGIDSIPEGVRGALGGALDQFASVLREADANADPGQPRVRAEPVVALAERSGMGDREAGEK